MGIWPVWDGRPATTALILSPTTTAANTKGAWYEWLAAAPFDLTSLTLRGLPQTESTLADIGVGAAGSEIVLVPNLLFASPSLATNYSNPAVCPVYVPKGTRLAVRGQTSKAGAATLGYFGEVRGAGFRAEKPLQHVQAYGPLTASSLGTAVLTGVGAYGAWVELSSAIGRTIHALMVMIGMSTDLTFLRAHVQVGIGAAGSEVPLYESSDALWAAAGEQGPIYGPFACSLPAGTRVAIRGFGGTAKTIRVAAYGFA